MKARFAREYGKFGLRAARKPQAGYPLAGVVQVADYEGKGYVWVKFAEALVGAVGKALPYGLSAETPGYLKVIQCKGSGQWYVYAYYLEGNKGVLLWKAQTKPEWIKKVRRT